MSYTSLLIHICTVRRFTTVVGVVDDYGNPVETWGDHLTNQACRLASPGGSGAGSGRELKVGAELVIADYKLFVEDIDIIEQDKVIVGGITYEVLLVEGYSNDITSHHKQCWLRVVR